jgi:pyruvate ferredoxin oxidoreductase delta subunit
MSSLPGWKALLPGCPVTEPLSASRNLTGSWRSERPLWNHDHCVQCGVCDMFCPEACITQNIEGFYEANLDYCKGCGICMQECPTQCISMKQEEE